MFRSLFTLGFVFMTAAYAQGTYVVQEGDTLVGLAREYGTTVEAILETNNLTGTDLLAGAVLTLPPPDTYTVQAGDTLTSIAREAGLTVEELMVLNNLSDTRLLVGQELSLGGGTAEAPLTVQVEAGESLWSLAERFDVSVEELSSANNLSPDTLLEIGDELVIPGRVAEGDSSDQGGGAEPSVTVAAGESLSVIAERHGTTVDALVEANGLTSDVLNPGETLLLPPTGGAGAGRASGIVWPLSGVITSYYGPRSLLGMTYHYGLDIDGATGDPIVAAMGGTVTYSGWLGGYGYLVIVEANGVEYYYAHASELLVSVGQTVATGETIARVGATGRVTGSHLHFEIRVNGQSVDPLPYLERTAQLP